MKKLVTVTALIISVAQGQYTHEFTEIASVDDGGEAHDVAVGPDGTLFLANGSDGLRAYRFDGTSFTLDAHIDDVTDDTLAVGVEVGADGTVFLACGQGGVRAYIFDGSSFSNTAQLDSIWGWDLAVGDDGTIFVASRYGLRAFSYSGLDFLHLAHGGYQGHDIALGTEGILFTVNTYHGYFATSYEGVSFTNIAAEGYSSFIFYNDVIVSDDGAVYIISTIGFQSFIFEDSTFIRIASIGNAFGGSELLHCHTATLGDDGTIFVSHPSGLSSYIQEDTTFTRTAHIELDTSNVTSDGVLIRSDGTILLAHGDQGLLALSYAQTTGRVDDHLTLPPELRLYENYPNPFNPTTTIGYALPEKSEVNLTVFDVAGREVTTLAQSERTPGTYEVQWNGVDQSGNPVSTGVYFYRLRAGEYTQTIKMLYLK